MDLGGRPALVRVVERVMLCERRGTVVVATSTEPGDDVIASLCRQIGVDCFRGSEQDVLDRYYRCACEYRAEVVVRVTADCPLLAPELFDLVVETHLESEADYVSIQDLPLGIPAETLSMRALSDAWHNATAMDDREHVILYTLRRPQQHRVVLLPPPEPSMQRPDLRLTLDTEADYRLISRLYERLGEEVHRTPLPEMIRQATGAAGDSLRPRCPGEPGLR